MNIINYHDFFSVENLLIARLSNKILRVNVGRNISMLQNIIQSTVLCII